MDRAIRTASAWRIRFIEWLRAAWDACFTAESSPRSRWIARLWMGAHFLAGLWLWYYFLNGGSIQLELHDWSEAAKRYAILQDAVVNWKIPLHAPGTSALRGVTDRFVSVADTNLSPQVLLLRFLDIGHFALANTLLLYLLGFLGLVGLRSRMRLSPIAFSFLFLLTMFNGHITAHIAVGHLHWGAYLLAPGMVTAILRLVDEPEKWTSSLVAGGLVSFIFLQGAFHFYAMVLFFVGLMALFDRGLWKAAVRFEAVALLLSLPRILPAALDRGKFDTGYLGGFPSTGELWASLVSLRGPDAGQALSASFLSPLGWWEMDYYIGLAGVLLLVWYLLRPGPGEAMSANRVRAVVIPGLLLVILSIGPVYKIVHMLHVPLLDSQRVGSRLLFIPMTVLVTVAVVRLQRSLDGNRDSHLIRWGVLGLLMFLGNDLWQHFKLWRVANMGLLFSPVPLDLGRFYVSNHPDPVYVMLLSVGLVVALATSVSALVLVLQERRAARRLRDEV